MAEKIAFMKSIGGKILLVFMLSGIAIVLALALISGFLSMNALNTSSTNQLDAVSSMKKTQIENYIAERKGDLKVIAQTRDIHNAIDDLVRYHKEMEIGEADDYDMSSSKEGLSKKYNDIYKEVHKQLDKYCREYGYYDIFLICQPHGHVMYTWAREADLGTNLSAGKYRDSGLARAWEKARVSEEPIIEDMSAYEPSGGDPAMFVAAPVINEDGTRDGVLAIQLPLSRVNAIMQERSGMGETGESYLVGEDKLMRSDSFLDPTGHSVKASFKGNVQQNGVDTRASREALSGKSGHAIISDYNGNPVLSDWDYIDFGEFKWAIISEIDQAEVMAPVMELFMFIGIAAVIFTALLILIAIVFSRSLSVPIRFITEGADRLAEGDADMVGMDRKMMDKINKRKDELGGIGRSFSNLIEYFEEKSSIAESIAVGDLRIELKAKSENDKLGHAFIATTDSLNDIMAQIQSAVDQVASGSNQVSEASQSLSQGATEQASSLEEISSSINEIAGQSRQNAENAGQANALAQEASNNAGKGDAQMQELLQNMQAINASSDQIKKVVKVIDDIAFQINLLALNANVEAARAGKYGKGFAVVAEEVRNLAAKSAASVQETTAMVEESLANIDKGNKAAQLTAEQLQNIVTGATKVADLLNEIAAASKEQALGIDQINSGLEQIDQVTQANTASSEESASAAEELAAQGQQLAAMISHFKLREEKQRVGQARKRPAKLTGQNQSRGQNAFQQKTQIAAAPKAQKTPPASQSQAIKPVNPKDVIKLDDDDFQDF